MNRNTSIRSLVCVATAAALVVLAGPGAGAASPYRARGAGELRDLQLASSEATDHAAAQVVATESNGTTTVTLKVQGLDHAAVGNTYGAHVHIGSCIEGNGGAALGHYNAGGGISDETEVWLDFTVAENGTGYASATVPFTIDSGDAGAVVIHAAPTNHTTGAAGPRWACLPVQF